MNFNELSEQQKGFADDVNQAAIILSSLGTPDNDYTTAAHHLAICVLSYVRLGLLKSAARIQRAEESERAQLAMED